MTETDNENRPIKQRSARNRLMDLLARRNYSELEIKQKLGPYYPELEIQNAIEFARESKWLLPPEELSEQVANSLNRKRKGHRFINQYLRTKGLPPVQRNTDEEVEKGVALAHVKLARKLALELPLDFDDQRKIQRLLVNRGYDEDTIRLVIRKILSDVRINAGKKSE